MFFKEESRIMSVSVSDDQLRQQTLNTQGTTMSMMMEDANMRGAKVKMEEVREENERLKVRLSHVMRDYHSLKMQFNGITTTLLEDGQSKKLPTNLTEDDDESELVSLSLGRFSDEKYPYPRKEEMKTSSNNKSKNFQLENDNWKLNSAENLKEEDVLLRSSRKNSRNIGDDEDEIILQHNIPLKKPRVSVRAVCNTQTMHDGCQWRKYGQKIAKGNPCPRAYYRCTVSSSCPVRKQVQRCMDDMSILVSTYEGSHNHPLPPSATSMASATSAAVAMLTCTSTTSTSASTSTSTSTLLGLNINQFTTNFPQAAAGRATISSSQSQHPTVILDLTPPNHSNNFSSSSTLFPAPHSLNFSSFDPNKTGWKTKFPTPNYINSHQPPPFFSSTQKQAENDHKIAAATEAITHDPTFQSALAAAITSFVGSSNSHGRRSSPGMNYHLMNFSQPSIKGCAASFINRPRFPQPEAMNSQQKNMTHFSPLSLSRSASKSLTMSLDDEAEGEEIINL